MAQQEFYTILTAAGLAYEANRKAGGLPIKLTQMSVGDGNGAVYNPDASQTALRREVWRGPINALLQDATNPSYLVGELSLPDDVGGWYVREVGFWTDTGVLYAIGKYPESFKPLLAAGAGKEFYIRAIFETSNAASVTLVVDDTVVKATRSYVIDFVAGEISKLDFKNSVRVATTENIVLSGAQAIDGIAVVAGNRVLVKNQTVGSENGIYVAANGSWGRAADADTGAKVTAGLMVPVEAGSLNSASVWQVINTTPITVGTSIWIFEMAAGRTGVAIGSYARVSVDNRGRVTSGVSTLGVSYGGTGATTPSTALSALGGAPLASPSLTGIPAAPTAAAGTSTTQLATTAFVMNAEANQLEAEAGAVSGKWLSPLRLFQALRAVAFNASEALRGVLRVATQAEVTVGTADDLAVTPKKLRFGVSSVLGPIGYIALPSWLGGVILQWGYVAVTSAGSGATGEGIVTFATTFPNEVWACPGTQEQASGGIGGNAALYQRLLTTSGVRFGLDDYGGSLGATTIRYFAIGR